MQFLLRALHIHMVNLNDTFWLKLLLCRIYLKVRPWQMLQIWESRLLSPGTQAPCFKYQGYWTFIILWLWTLFCCLSSILKGVNLLMCEKIKFLMGKILEFNSLVVSILKGFLKLFPIFQNILSWKPVFVFRKYYLKSKNNWCDVDFKVAFSKFKIM